MEQIFVQSYRITKSTPVLSLTSDHAIKKEGKIAKGEKVQGVMRLVQVKSGKNTESVEYLNIGKNNYINPKDVILDVLSSAEGELIQSPLKPSVPFIIGALPFVGIGAGLLFAHHRINKTGSTDKWGNYIGWALLGGFLLSIPYARFKMNTKTDLKDTANKQKDKALTDTAFENLQELAKKQNKKIEISRGEFGNQFASLDDMEKNAFIFIQEGTLALDMKSQNFSKMYLELNKKAQEKYGESTMESLTTKMGNFNK